MYTPTGTARMSVYQAPEWGSRVVRTATISLDDDGTYSVDWMPVVALSVIGLFTMLTCADDSTHVVLTAFLRLVRAEPHASAGGV